VKQLILKFIPAFAWACIVAALCLLPQNVFYEPGFLRNLPADKIVHFGMFFILSFLVWRGMPGKLLGFFNYRFLLVLIILIAYGGMTELAQDWLTKTRHSEIMDFLTDIVGILFGLCSYLLLAKRKISAEKELAKY
jgi:VanZ family protein